MRVFYSCRVFLSARSRHAGLQYIYGPRLWDDAVSSSEGILLLTDDDSAQSRGDIGNQLAKLLPLPIDTETKHLDPENAGSASVIIYVGQDYSVSFPNFLLEYPVFCIFYVSYI